MELDAKDVLLVFPEKRKKRFEIIVVECRHLSESGYMKVIMDKEIGVNGLFVKSGYRAGVTSLLDAGGRVIETRERV